jgi:hypothetical protein
MPLRQLKRSCLSHPSQIASSKPATGNEKKSEVEAASTPPPEVMLVSESVLIINQTAVVHKQIDQFLRSLNLPESALGQKSGQMGGGGMGGGGFF